MANSDIWDEAQNQVDSLTPQSAIEAESFERKPQSMGRQVEQILLDVEWRFGDRKINHFEAKAALEALTAQTVLSVLRELKLEQLEMNDGRPYVLVEDIDSAIATWEQELTKGTKA